MVQNNSVVPMSDATPAPDTGIFSDARIAMIRNTIAKDAPEDVFRAMIDIARKRNLDPLAKQIQCVRFGGSWQFITTIDGHRAIAEQTGQYAGNDAPVFTWPDPIDKTKAGKKRPESATVTVYKILHGQRFGFAATVFWDEYNTGINNWSSMPCTMLAKVAESHALRKAFPAVLSGTYTGDEMGQAGYVDSPGGMTDRQTGEIAPQSRQDRPQRAERPAPKAEVIPGGREEVPYDSAPPQDRPGPSSGLVLTDRQKGLIQALAREGKISNKAIDDRCRERFGAPLAEISRADASAIIESMRAAQEQPEAMA